MNPVVRIIDEANQRLAIGMRLIAGDVRNEFVAQVPGVQTGAGFFDLNDNLFLFEEEVETRPTSRMTWTGLLAAHIIEGNE
ncbi:hypothetical protein D7X74_21400 [Corallococcus sp. CA047B]|nr:hypothetical protein D7X74_21400 [Corallococcus sp. CA047B]